MASNKETILSPILIFIIYVTAFCLLIFGYNYFFSAGAAPLKIFSSGWYFNRSLLDILALFPALALSALVIPLGIASEDEIYSRFSPLFFKRIKKSVITAIIASSLYALLFLLVQPVAQKYEKDMLFKSEMYNIAKEQAWNSVKEENWIEASQFIGICDSVWPNNPDLEKLQSEIKINIEELQFYSENKTSLISEFNQGSVFVLPGQKEPLNAKDAIIQSETAFQEGNFLDAHWFAVIGERISRIGSQEREQASRLALRAWNEIENQSPGEQETSIYALHQKKLIGYEAMVSGEWIRAFYIFQELQRSNPYDPDIENFLKASEQNTRNLAFFLNEMEITPGQTFTGALFSLPFGHNGMPGRSVLRVSSLNSSMDYAYGLGIEYMLFDEQSNLILSMEAPYAKFLPVTIGDQPQTLVLLRALDFKNAENQWEPRWMQNETEYSSEPAQITFNISYDMFLALSRLRQGISGMSFSELLSASQIAESTGYIPQVFEEEIINRLSLCVFFLPLTVITIAMGWAYRSKKRSRFIFIIMLFVLPLLFNVIIHLYQTIIGIIGISLILALGFSAALALMLVFAAVLFIGFLFVLAAQRSTETA